MSKMIVWVYLSTIDVHGKSLDAVGEGQMKFAFISEQTCKRMIEGLKAMKCIPLELVQ